MARDSSDFLRIWAAGIRPRVLGAGFPPKEAMSARSHGNDIAKQVVAKLNFEFGHFFLTPDGPALTNADSDTPDHPSHRVVPAAEPGVAAVRRQQGRHTGRHSTADAGGLTGQTTVVTGSTYSAASSNGPAELSGSEST
jgi:hypothetical protein